MNKRINKKNKILSEYVHDFLIEIRKPTYVTPFKNPVDPNEIPHYYSVIKNPMDLSTMYQKLLDGKYQFLSEVKEDFHLVITNCEVFNPPNTWIRPLCDKFKVNLEKSWAKLIETLERKAIDIRKPMEKLPEFEEAKNEIQSIWLPNIIAPDNLGFRTRNQVSIMKDSLNESTHSNDISKDFSNKEIQMPYKELPLFMKEMSSSIIVKEHTNTLKEIQKEAPVLSREASFILKEIPSISQEIIPEIPAINEEKDNPVFENETMIVEKETLIFERNAMDVEKEPDLIVHLNCEEIRKEFKEYSQHKLRKYKKVVLKGVNKLYSIITGLEKSDPNNNDMRVDLEKILKEIELFRNDNNVDFNQICLCLVKALFWLRKNIGKIKEIKTNRRILAYFSSILKALRRINSISKRIKALDIPVSEEIFPAQDLGIAYFRENFHKIQAIFNPQPQKQAENISNSIKITLAKPPKEKSDAEIGPISLKAPKKMMFERPHISSPSTKIVMNKDLNKVKTFPLEAPVVENKQDKLLAWVSGINQKIHEKTDRFFHERLTNSNKEISSEKNEREEKQILIENQAKCLERKVSFEENPMFEERKSPIIINLPQKKQMKKTNIFEEKDKRDFYENYVKIEFEKNEPNNESSQFLEEELEDERQEEEEEEETKNQEIIIEERKKKMKFNEILIDKQILIKVPDLMRSPNNNEVKMLIEEISIYSLFKEIDEEDKNSFDEIVKNIKKTNNDKLKFMKNDRIVDKSSKCLLEISQEISLDKIIKIVLKLKNINNDFSLTVQNILNIDGFELFSDLKRIQKLHELNLVENSNWFDYDILSKKLMKNMLYDALLNQLIKVSKFQMEKDAGIYYCFEKIPNENNGFMLIIWSAVEKLANFKLTLNELNIL